jgi:hypothetical protein
MARWGFGSVRARAIIVQVAVVAGVIIGLKFALPEIQKDRAAAQLARREQKIEAFVQSTVVEGGGEESEVSTAEGVRRVRPKVLRITPAAGDVRQALGAPDESMTDFRGGQHLIWYGNKRFVCTCLSQARQTFSAVAIFGHCWPISSRLPFFPAWAPRGQPAFLQKTKEIFSRERPADWLQSCPWEESGVCSARIGRAYGKPQR